VKVVVDCGEIGLPLTTMTFM